MKLAALAAALVLGGCASVSPVATVDPPSALNGKGLDTAISLYGPYSDRVVRSGRDYYVWRRSELVDGKPLACELRAEVGYRATIRATQVEGHVAACQVFWIHYTSSSETRTRDDEPAQANAPKVAANRCANCRPVGVTRTTETAAVSKPRPR